jgi:hypothetical protein
MELTRSQRTRFSVWFLAEPRLYRSRVERSRRNESLKYRARTVFEGRKSAAAFVAAERIAIFIEDRNFAAANEKTPLAAHTVIKPCLLLKNRMLAKGPNNKFVPGGPWARFTAGEVVCPELHEVPIGNCRTSEKSTDLQGKIAASRIRISNHCGKIKCRIAF